MVHSPSERDSRRSRTPRGRETADQFVDAALRLVAERGLEGLTIQRLASETGYAVGALYRHFPGKGALLAAMQGQVVRDLRQDLQEVERQVERALDVPASERDEATEALAHLVAAARVYADFARCRPERFGLLSLTLGDPRTLVRVDEEGEAVVPVLADLAGAVAGRFERATRSGALEPGDPERRGILLWASLHGVLQLRKLERFEVASLSSGPLVQELLRNCFVGWGADPARLERAMRIAEAVRPAVTEEDTT